MRLVVAAMFVVGCSSESARAPAPVEPAPAIVVRYLALGDSFTAGTGASREESFPARLASRVEQRGCHVAFQNLAVNGYRTDQVLTIELPKARGFAPTWVTLAIGANDLVAGRSISDYRANVRAILDELGRQGVAGAAIVGIPQPRWAETRVGRSFGSPAELAIQIEGFNSVLREEVESGGGRFVDLGARMARESTAGMVAPDGLHPTAPAYDEWAADLDLALAWPCRQVKPQTSVTK